MPYVMFSGIKVPNRFWPSSIASQLRGPQTELNMLKSQVAENAKRIGNPALMKSRQANVKYTGLPGEEILFDATMNNAVPAYLEPPSMPTYVLQQIERAENAMIEISGQHEVSNATVPTGVTAAAAINLLQEADDTRIGPEIQDMEDSIAEAANKAVRLRALYNTDERTLRLAGEEGNWDVFAFRNTMLGEEPTVECQAGSTMPRTQAAKQAAVLSILQTMLQNGVAPSKREMARVFRDYEVGDLDQLFGTVGASDQQIQRENHFLSEGQALPINAYDEDETHVEGHEEFQRTAAYQKLSPEVQQTFELHVNAHRERIVQHVNNQIAAQARSQQGAQLAQSQEANAQQQQGHEQQLEQQSHQAALDTAREGVAAEREEAPEQGAEG
jgi:hypothetical protein